MRVEYSNADRSRPAFHIHEDVHGHIWVHPYGGGFSYFDRDRNCLVPFYDDLGSNNWRFSNKIHAAFSDKQGNLWVGLKDGMIRLYPLQRTGESNIPQRTVFNADSRSA